MRSEELFLGQILRGEYDRLGFSHLVPSFSKVRHRLIWRAIQQVARRGGPVDLMAVARELQEKGLYEEAGATEYLAGLIHAEPPPPLSQLTETQLQRQEELRQID